MTKWRKGVEHVEKPEECCSCGFKTEELEEYGPTAFQKPARTKWMCLLCASTMAGNAYDYPDQYRENADVLKTICFVGNTILRAIGEVALGRATNPFWQNQRADATSSKPLDIEQLNAMIEAFNRCTRGTSEAVNPEIFPQDATAAASVLGDICPRCGTDIRGHQE